MKNKTREELYNEFMDKRKLQETKEVKEPQHHCNDKCHFVDGVCSEDVASHLSHRECLPDCPACDGRSIRHDFYIEPTPNKNIEGWEEQPEVLKWIEQGRDSEQVWAVRNLF